MMNKIYKHVLVASLLMMGGTARRRRALCIRRRQRLRNGVCGCSLSGWRNMNAGRRRNCGKPIRRFMCEIEKIVYGCIRPYSSEEFCVPLEQSCSEHFVGVGLGRSR